MVSNKSESLIKSPADVRTLAAVYHIYFEEIGERYRH